MSPVEVLLEEHRVIEGVLNCLERLVDEGTASGRVDAESACDAVAFFRGYAEDLHHDKEELHLFPAMEAKGLSKRANPTIEVLLEHEAQREYLAKMDQSALAAAAGNKYALAEFAQNARRFVEMLRQHIAKEDDDIFPLANEILDQAVQQKVLAGFMEVDAHRSAGGKFIRIADALAQRYGAQNA
ncbi:MAG: hemerythrin domain-containing protein [Planctomycetota bacterium]